MTAKASRRIRQPDARCLPNRSAVLNKKNVVALPRLPLAQLHPRKHCRETSAARIRKAGRILAAPLPQLQPWLFSTKNGVDAPLPLAQLHPRNALPRVFLAARIRKAGRILAAPLPQLQPWLFSTKNGVDAPLPLAQHHPRNALPRVSLAARIRKAGRCLTAPLARRHSAQRLGVASASCRTKRTLRS
jgi:hypothetical protein